LVPNWQERTMPETTPTAKFTASTFGQ
jgi:hypothetical protein